MTTQQPASDYGVPTITTPQTAEHFDYYSSSLDVYLRSEQTGGQFFASRSTGRPGDAPPFHVHTREDEIWIINSGEFRFWIGGDSLDSAETYDVGPGAMVYGPRNVAHTFQALSESGDVTIFWSPGGSQSYFLNVPSSDEREDFEHPERLTAIGVQVLDRAPVDGR